MLNLTRPINQPLTFSTLDPQISQLEAEMAQLQQQISQKKAIKKAIEQKKQLAIKTLSKLEIAISSVVETTEQLGEAAEEIEQKAIALVQQYFKMEEIVAEEIVAEPEQTEKTKELIFLDGLVYDPNRQIAYCAARNKSRADTYGYWLTKQYKIATKYQVRVTEKQATRLVDSKYQLEIQGISEADAIHLAKFNFLLEVDSSDHKELLAHWNERKVVLPPAYQRTPKPTPLEKISVGDRVHKGNPQDLYEVKSLTEINGQLMANVVCLRHKDFPTLEGQNFTFRDVYLVTTL